MRVLIIAASTICGRISPGVMGSRQDRSFLEKMRAETDASLLGAETLREGDPEMRGPGGVLPAGRMRAIISGSGKIVCDNRKLFEHGPKPIIFTGKLQSAELADRVGEKAKVVSLPRGPLGLSLPAAMDELGRRGAKSVLVEGGGKLNYACLSEGVVDEILLTITPYISGDSAAATIADGPSALGEPFVDFELVACEAAETGEIFCRYKIKK